MTARQVVDRTAVVRAPRRAVWAALADPALLGRWLGGAVDADLRPGARGVVRDADGDHRMLIEAIDPGRRLVFHWARRSPGVDVVTPSTVEIVLADDPVGTRVSVTESALADSPWPVTAEAVTGVSG